MLPYELPEMGYGFSSPVGKRGYAIGLMTIIAAGQATKICRGYTVVVAHP